MASTSSRTLCTPAFTARHDGIILDSGLSNSSTTSSNTTRPPIRKAVLIGINYYGDERHQVLGCINNVANMSALLQSRLGYKSENMVILTELTSPCSESLPIARNILKAMHWLVMDAQPGDTLFFYYSGHGSFSADGADRDEADGYDECICPLDAHVSGLIVDDLMHDIMVKPLKKGVRLTAMFDCCHSGSALDLPYTYDVSGKQTHISTVSSVMENLRDAVAAYPTGDMLRILSNGKKIFKRLKTGRKAEYMAFRTKASEAEVIQWSGSKDSQYGMNFMRGGQWHGVMTGAFIQAYLKNPHQSYAELLDSTRKSIRESLGSISHLVITQIPQLSCSHSLDTSLPVVM
ncbi:peptidase C14, caspase domain-containing protein [Pyronema domesticum]|nr:peptidase C14, caspase domain-containing protein [Pyronema domesticum]